MNAILVAVDYTDLLSLTLPWNRANFGRVLVVTSTDCSQDDAVGVCRRNDAEVYRTDAFTRNGADFNKFLALEEALDARDYRRGWLCVMDADVLWPRGMAWEEGVCACCGKPDLAYAQSGFRCPFHFGFLHTPYRRMCPDIFGEAPAVPPESEWGNYRQHGNRTEFPGYTQIFHAEDPALGPPPWHQTNWRHAGGGDSFFQRKWPADRKIRPPWEVLHLGPAGTNWAGRTDGGRSKLRGYMAARRRRPDPEFRGERLG